MHENTVKEFKQVLEHVDFCWIEQKPLDEGLILKDTQIFQLIPRKVPHISAKHQLSS
ncbi:MAG: hypothetical protein HQ569_04025 [Actinobacteria bacterium]|nr:hypothetical protein [Actinomycetota bacterium]